MSQEESLSLGILDKIVNDILIIGKAFAVP